MSRDAFFNTTFLDTISDQIDRVPGQAVSMTKPVARAMVTELRRFYGTQDAAEGARIELIQKLTFQYACQHICDLLRSISDHNPNDEVAAAMMFAVSEIMMLSKQTELKTMGTA